MTSKQEAPRKPVLFRAADHAQLKEQTQSHPLNPNSLLRGISLSEQVGLQRLGFHLLRIPPGKESFIFHLHQSEEEFLYILSGRGIAELGEESVEVGPGDFMGFPTPSVGHHLRNPFQEELVYISGGERRQVEVADFPRLGKRLVRFGTQVSIFDVAAVQNLSFGEE
ncbi:MAG: cupin domain-containing protein [Hyalangium sp.]|uniref:cupin domain-containing protein n=1 Tax=Hyalangium sp. TaxID=2028555 RepID=UPI00389B3447